MTEDRPSSALHILSAVAGAMARGPDLDASLGTLLGTATEAVGAVAGAVYVQDQDRVSLEPLLAIGVAESNLDALGNLGEGDPSSADPATAASRDGQLTVVRHRAGLGAFGVASGCASGAFVPLLASRDGIDAPLGVLVVGWEGVHELAPDEAELLSALANLGAVAVDRARLASMVTERAEWFERLAHTDPLTGLANQRTFGRILELEVARASRQESEVSLAFVDVDGFQAINEAGGREAGDAVLRAVAAVLAESVRLVDTVARHGGDEFVIVAPGSAAMAVARRIQSAVARLPGTGGAPLSVSIGVSRFPVDGASAEELVETARRALEDARAAGGGRIAEAKPQPT